MPTVVPSLALIFVTESPSQFATQMFAPSKGTLRGPAPAGYVPTIVPSLGRSFVTLLAFEFAIHKYAPSNAKPYGSEFGGPVKVALLLHQLNVPC